MRAGGEGGKDRGGLKAKEREKVAKAEKKEKVPPSAPKELPKADQPEVKTIHDAIASGDEERISKALQPEIAKIVPDLIKESGSLGMATIPDIRAAIQAEVR